MAKIDAPAPLKQRDRVVATRALPTVPEGTRGVVKISNGLIWERYWVKFANGVWLGSVSGTDLVREGDWEDFQRRRAEEAARPAAPAAEAGAPDPAAGAGAEPAPAGPASRVPAHLLERSQKARERRAAGQETA